MSLEDEIRQHTALLAREQEIMYWHERLRPSSLYLPRLSMDGDHWCALFGENLQDGVVGFGKSPQEAYADFDRAWREGLAAEQPAQEGEKPSRPTVVCLCGSTRFKDTFVEHGLGETLAGKIVLSIGCDMRSDNEIFGHLTPDEFRSVKTDLDRLHLRKIDLADEVLILNVGGYIGESTGRELAYARAKGKAIRFLEPEQEGKSDG